MDEKKGVCGGSCAEKWYDKWCAEGDKWRDGKTYMI